MRTFLYAIEGIISGMKSERHMRIHACVAFYVILAGIVTKISATEWMLAIVMIGAVIALELVNTALEALCDTVTREKNPGIKIAKDCAAGAVLVMAIAAATAGCVMFFSKGRPMTALQFALDHKIAAGIIVLTLPAWIYYIFFHRRSHK